MRRLGRQRCGFSRRGPFARAGGIACGLALLATGCVEAAWDLTVHHDGSGSFAWTYEFDDAAASIDSQDGDPGPEAACERFLERFDRFGPVRPRIAGVETRVEYRHLNGVCTYAASVAWTADESEDVLASLALNHGPRIGRAHGHGWSFDLDTRFVEDYVDAGGPLFETAGNLDPTFVLALTLPGTLVETNADSSGGFTHVWIIDLSDIEGIPTTLHAETATESDTFLPQLVGIILLVVLFALVARFRLLKRRRSRSIPW